MKFIYLHRLNHALKEIRNSIDFNIYIDIAVDLNVGFDKICCVLIPAAISIMISPILYMSKNKLIGNGKSG